MSAALLSALLFGNPGQAGPDGTRDPDADEPADVRARLLPPPLARRAPAPVRLQVPPSGAIATLMTRTSSSRSSPPPLFVCQVAHALRRNGEWPQEVGRDPAGSDAAAGEQEEGQDGGGGVRDPGHPTGYPTSVRFDMHRALDDLAGLTTEQPHD